MKGLKQLVWSPAAKEDLVDIWRYFARVAAPEIADSLLHEIDRASSRLQYDPLLGQLRMDVMSIKGGLRSVFAHPYTSFYRLGDTEEVQIVRVLLERQVLPTILADDQP